MKNISIFKKKLFDFIQSSNFPTTNPTPAMKYSDTPEFFVAGAESECDEGSEDGKEAGFPNGTIGAGCTGVSGITGIAGTIGATGTNGTISGNFDSTAYRLDIDPLESY